MITPNDISLGIEFNVISLCMDFKPINLGMEFYEAYTPFYVPIVYPWLFGDESEMLYGDLTIMTTYL